MKPAALGPGLREHLAGGLPEAQRPVADRERRGAHAAAGAVAQQVRPRLGRLAQALGLTQQADFPSVVAVLVSAAFTVRALKAAMYREALLAGTFAGVALALKPANALYLGGPALAFLLARRWSHAAIFAAGGGGALWVSLVLALSFGFYGLIRKVAAIDALGGLTMETLILAPFALVVLVQANQSGTAAFGHDRTLERVRSYGRADLFIASPTAEDYVEAKIAWPRGGPRPVRAGRVLRKLDEACSDARSLDLSEVGGRRVLEVDADSADETFFEGIGKLSTVGGALR